MIFVRANPAYYGHLSPCAGTDQATIVMEKKKKAAASASCHNNKNIATKNNQKESAPPRMIVEKSPLHREETAEKTVISLDIAGFTTEQLKIEIDDHVLAVSGARTNKLGDTFVTHRRFALKANTYDEDEVQATLNEGILELSISKKPETKARQIPILVSSPKRKEELSPALESIGSATSDRSETENMADPASPIASDSEEVSVETVDEKYDEAEEEAPMILESSDHSKNHDWEEVVKA